MADQRIKKWTRWIDGTIKNNVLTMHLHRDAWQEMSRLLRENGTLPDSYWWEFMIDTYITTQAVAVRRQADSDDRVASLGKLIEQIRDDAERLTRGYWIGLWDPGDDPFERLIAERQWSDTYGGEVGTHLDPRIPAADCDALKQAAAHVKHFVDRHLAHSDSRAVSSNITLTVAEVHEAIETIGTLFRRYYGLLTANDLATLVPVIQHDWMAVFREPWMRPRER